MHKLSRLFQCTLTGAILASSFAASGCAVRARIYDTEHSDYHRWNGHERIYYNQWVGETHRPNREFATLKPEEQREYWTWRHNHPDRK